MKLMISKFLGILENHLMRLVHFDIYEVLSSIQFYHPLSFHNFEFPKNSMFNSTIYLQNHFFTHFSARNDCCFFQYSMKIDPIYFKEFD